MSRGLTIKQDKFAREYVKTGNGSLAARKAGYTSKPDSAAVQSTRLLSNAKVSDAIKQLRRRQAERLDISREKIVNDVAHIAEQAQIEGEYTAAINANTLIMKAQGYLVERSMNVSVDVTQSHLDALQAYTDQRISEQLDQRIGDRAKDARGASASPSVTDLDSDGS